MKAELSLNTGQEMGLGASRETCSSHCASISVRASQCKSVTRVQLSAATLHRSSVRITEVCALGESLRSNNQAGPLISAVRKERQVDL